MEINIKLSKENVRFLEQITNNVEFEYKISRKFLRLISIFDKIKQTESTVRLNGIM